MPRARRRRSTEAIEDAGALSASFTKRRQGLFKKQVALSILCRAQSVVLVRSPGGKIFALGEPDVESVIARFLSNQPMEELEIPDDEWRRKEELYRLLQLHLFWLESARLRLRYLSTEATESRAAAKPLWDYRVEDLDASQRAAIDNGLLNSFRRARQKMTRQNNERGTLGGTPGEDPAVQGRSLVPPLGFSGSFSLAGGFQDLAPGSNFLGFAGGVRNLLPRSLPGNNFLGFAQNNPPRYGFQGFGNLFEGSQNTGGHVLNQIWRGESSSSSSSFFQGESPSFPAAPWVGEISSSSVASWMGDGRFSFYQSLSSPAPPLLLPSPPPRPMNPFFSPPGWIPRPPPPEYDDGSLPPPG